MPRQVIRGENHHWWPTSLSNFWKDEAGNIQCMRPDGSTRPPQPPRSVGAISNAHNLLFRTGSSVWDATFEDQFDKADSSFPETVNWLKSAVLNVGIVDGDIENRLAPVRMGASRHAMLAECLSSLIARSPNLRARIRKQTEEMRRSAGFADPSVDKNLVAANQQYAHSAISRTMASGGKFLLLVASDKEFIFGDGFFHNVSHITMPVSSPTCLIALTPKIGVLYTQPIQYRTFPRAFALNLTTVEVDVFNEITQIYCKDFVFFRSQKPTLSQHFERGEHLQFNYHKSPWIDSLSEAIATSLVANAREYDCDLQ